MCMSIAQRQHFEVLFVEYLVPRLNCQFGPEQVTTAHYQRQFRTSKGTLATKGIKSHFLLHMSPQNSLGSKLYMNSPSDLFSTHKKYGTIAKELHKTQECQASHKIKSKVYQVSILYQKKKRNIRKKSCRYSCLNHCKWTVEACKSCYHEGNSYDFEHSWKSPLCTFPRHWTLIHFLYIYIFISRYSVICGQGY